MTSLTGAETNQKVMNKRREETGREGKERKVPGSLL